MGQNKHLKKIGYPAVSLLIILLGCSSGKKNEKLVIKPAMGWLDNNNIHINAHGGGIIESEGLYYWFGEHKIEGRRGNRAMVGVHCYSSKNLVDWKDEGIALPVIENDTTHDITKGCVIERPKVVYNENTKTFVMWFHLEKRGEGYASALSAVATSKNVTGPYIFHKAYRPNAKQWPVGYPDNLKSMVYNTEKLKDWSDEWLDAIKRGMYLKRDFEKGQMSRDMTVFVDDDQKAYHIHAAEDNLTLHISLLTSDYLDFTAIYYRIMPAGHNEAPAIFKKDGKYFMVTSGCTGWEPNAARLLVAGSMSGEWEMMGNPCVGKDSAKTFFSQSTFVLPIKDDKFIFMADRWAPKNPIDGKYIWLPVLFNEKGLPFLKWYDEWNINDL